MHVPPLVTRSPTGTARTAVGVLGEPDTDIIYGDNEILDESRSGFRIRLGGWIDPQKLWGIEGEYFTLGDETEVFTSTSNNGSPLIARPFFNINPRDSTTGAFSPPAREDAELIGFPGLVEGSVQVSSSSELDGAGANLLLNLCCNNFACGGYNQFSRVDLLLGYRYMQLRERLTIDEQLSSLDAANPLDFDITDRFSTRNQFHGFDLGTKWQTGWYRWTLEFLAKMAIGNVSQTVTVNGETTFDRPVGPSETFDGGLLAQRTNIGKHTRDDLAVIPELGATLGFFLTPRLRGTVGYTFLYWSQVARPGEQVDLDLNPDLLPPEADPFTGAARPRFVFRDTDFWAQGLNLGLDYRW